MIRRLVFLLFVLLILAVAVAAVYLLVPLVGDLSGKSLAHSVARETDTKGELKKASCRKQARKRRFACRVPAGKGKPAVKYRVQMEDRRCWTARRGSGGSGKRRRKGCVGLRDQLRLGLLEKIL